MDEELLATIRADLFAAVIDDMKAVLDDHTVPLAGRIDKLRPLMERAGRIAETSVKMMEELDRSLAGAKMMTNAMDSIFGHMGLPKI